MRTFLQLVFGLLVLKAVSASPRFSRQVDYDSYDAVDYNEGEDNFDLNNYDYEEELRVEEAETDAEKPEYNYPEPGEVEKKEEEEEEEELPLKPQLVPQGSGGSGVLMGPDTEKEVELRQTAIDTLHVSGDFGGSVGSGETSAASGASGSGLSGDTLVSSASGDLLDDIVLISGDPEELPLSSGSGEFLTGGVLLISGDVSGSGDITGSATSGASGDISVREYEIVTELPIGSGGSGDQSGSGLSGDPLGSGASGISGVSGDSSESGYSGITLISGEEELPPLLDKEPSEVLSASGEISGEIEASVDSELSGTSGLPSVSGSGDVTVILQPHQPDKEEELLPATPDTPQEGKTSVDEETVSSGIPEPDEPEEPDEVIKKGLPVCLLCTCLGGSVYCDDLKLDSVPPLPKDTTHFYARYNRITKISKSDFANMNKLKKIDLTANEITSIEDRTFMGLPELEELIIRENHISQLPTLPETMTLIDASHNDIGSKGIHKEAFKDMTGLQFLYLTDNNIDYVPVPLPDSLRSLHLQGNNIQMMHEDTFCNLNDFNYIRNALEDIRLDGNPINLSKTPQAYVCLPRIPIGNLI
ncbi:epiphycan isoform X1 [Fundulus heteroclitus]|uniref:epiphycan isoform X1 n=1 Tax=Fundulus heteroclitus TaxID=8078 RepID=UPI00165C780E|nr:epiphycan isoform X1 [Fundulus heteroclitus]